ncbi:UDP-glucuronosyltransferase 1-6-like [Triplophysa dalaica]|uniref:UDP-glucuronosyltransferase 1-6-like n=1 Tax=Triplophysa dalaica TaxID=1582913 RepID=UPI0024DFBB9A|nr:UDP-glucuronosyltransferase 1-6-like [Triplophysa dalaica]
MDCKAFLCLAVFIICCAALKQNPDGKSGWTGKLLVVPMDGSHWTGVKAVAEEMGRKGHLVIVLMPEVSMRLGPGKHYITKMFPVSYSRDFFDQVMANYSDLVTTSPGSLLESVVSKVDQVKKLFKVFASTGESLFKNQELIDFIREQNFDAVLTDPVLPIGAILAYNLSLPAVYMLRGMPCGLDACPNPPSYIPRFLTRYSDRMTFGQRVVNTLVSILEVPLCKLMFWPFEEMTSSFIQRDVSVMEILSSGALWLMRYDYTLEFPKPLMPNMVLIGGINCEVRNPLTKVSV